MCKFQWLQLVNYATGLTREFHKSIRDERKLSDEVRALSVAMKDHERLQHLLAKRTNELESKEKQVHRVEKQKVEWDRVLRAAEEMALYV